MSPGLHQLVQQPHYLDDVVSRDPVEHYMTRLADTLAGQHTLLGMGYVKATETFV